MRLLNQRPAGIGAFTIVWLGQAVSLLGTGMTNFAVTLWAFEVTGKATPLAMIGFFFFTPMVVLGPFIGVLIDRGDRRWLMILSDLASGLITVLILALHLGGRLEVWHLYVTASLYGTFQGFQWPAYSAAITMMLPKRHYTRASGMLEMAGSGSAVLSPLAAGALIGPLGLTGILALDLVSAAVAIAALLAVRIPRPAASEAGLEATGSFFKEAAYGFRYLFARPSLVGLQTVFLIGNFFRMLPFAVMAPMILGRTGGDELVFGSVQSVGAIGGVLGGLAMSTWGGPKRRIHGVLQAWLWMGLVGQPLFGIARSLPFWVLGIFIITFFGPVANGSNQAIWQAKVPPDVQGRVFSARRFIAWLVTPVCWLLAGPLADRVLEPAMAEGGELAGTFAWLVGTGSGAGIGLLFVVCGLLMTLAAAAGYLTPLISEVEDSLPDHGEAESELPPQRDFAERPTEP